MLAPAGKCRNVAQRPQAMSRKRPVASRLSVRPNEGEPGRSEIERGASSTGAFGATAQKLTEMR